VLFFLSAPTRESCMLLLFAKGRNMEPIDPNEARRLYETWAAEKEGIDLQVEEHSKAIDALRVDLEILDALLTNLRRRYPDIIEDDVMTTNGVAVLTIEPRGQEAALRVLVENEGWMSVVEVQAELKKRGWLVGAKRPEDAARASLTRLFKLGRVRRRKKGRAYLYLAPMLASENSDAPIETIGASELASTEEVIE